MQDTKPEHKEPTLGRRVASQRALKGWTQVQLAEQAGLHPLQIGRIENGHSEPSLPTLRTFSTLFGVSLDWLVFGDEPAHAA